MNPIETWGEAITFSLVSLWERFVNFLPSLIGALLVFLAGLVVASILGKAAEKLTKLIRVDNVIERMGLNKFKDSGLNINASVFLGELVKWFFVLVFLMAATDILGLSQVTNFLNSIILYIPNIIVAVIILSLAFLLGNFVHSLVKSSTKVAGVASAAVIATVTRWSIVIFGLLAALIQLGIAAPLIQTVFTGVIAALALAIGLAFGLGGKDEASKILAKLREELEHK